MTIQAGSDIKLAGGTDKTDPPVDMIPIGLDWSQKVPEAHEWFGQPVADTEWTPLLWKHCQMLNTTCVEYGQVQSELQELIINLNYHSKVSISLKQCFGSWSGAYQDTHFVRMESVSANGFCFAFMMLLICKLPFVFSLPRHVHLLALWTELVLV